jgi:hypothetical protein
MLVVYNYITYEIRKVESEKFRILFFDIPGMAESGRVIVAVVTRSYTTRLYLLIYIGV